MLRADTEANLTNHAGDNPDILTGMGAQTFFTRPFIFGWIG
jgi:hypothetical protein